jgi:RNA polymerase sigma-70 factor (ECF subfamily)
MQLSDGALMRSDDPAAFGEVVRRHGRTVARVARTVAGESADDVVQQAFLSAWLARDRYDPARGALSTWLCGIARNRAIDVVRSERRYGRQRPLELADHVACPGDGPAELASRGARAAEVRAALRRISPAQRAALTLAYYGELTQVEIQERTGHPLGTVKGRLRLGLKAMRSELAEAA